MYQLLLLDNTGAEVEAQFTDAAIKNWSKRINGPGRLTFTLPASSPNATPSMLMKYKRVKLKRRKQDGSGEDEVVWYGYIEAHKRTGADEYTVFCAGMLQFFKYRFTAKDESFSGQGSTEAFGLLTATNSGDGDTGIVTGDGGVTGTKDLTAAGYRDILSMWEDLAKAHGAEFEITDESEFNFVPSIGTDKTETIDALVFRTDGEPGTNLAAIEEGEDGGALRTKVIGLNSGGTLTSEQEDADSDYPVLVEVKVFVEAQDQSTLDAMTLEHLNQVQQPVSDFQASPLSAERKFNQITNQLTIEGRQYGEIVPGDLVPVEIVTPNQEIEDSRRVLEIVVEVDRGEKETLKYTLGESGVFVSVHSLGSREPSEIKDRLLKLEQVTVSEGGGGGGDIEFEDREVPTGSINGSNTVYTLANTPDSGSEHVYLNGVLQMSGGTEYSISGVTITFVTAPPSGSTVVVSYRH